MYIFFLHFRFESEKEKFDYADCLDIYVQYIWDILDFYTMDKIYWWTRIDSQGTYEKLGVKSYFFKGELTVIHNFVEYIFILKVVECKVMVLAIKSLNCNLWICHRKRLKINL